MDNANAPAGAAPPAPPSAGTSVPRLLILLALGAVAAAGIYLAPNWLARESPPPISPVLRLGGTSIGVVMVEHGWRKAYLEKTGVQLDYQSVGSTAGAAKLTAGDFAVALTHAPLPDEQEAAARAKGGEVVHVPVLLCGIVPVYNVKELKDKPPLKLTGEALGDIFLGKITTWDDPALKALNPDLPLPPTKISVVHREDSSGTTQIFTDYLVKASGRWREKFGTPSAKPAWPVGAGAGRNLGVATRVFETEGAIGYVDKQYSRLVLPDVNMVLSEAAVQNKDRTAFVRAEPANLTAAAAAGEMPEDLTIDLTERPGKDSYPIAGVIYAVCYKAQPEERRRAVADFLRWAVRDGQSFAPALTFASLPPGWVARAEERVKLVAP